MNLPISFSSSAATTSTTPTARRTQATCLAAVLVIIACVWFRVTTSIDGFPGWGNDPTVMYTPPTGVTPFWGLLVDAVAVVASAVVVALRAGTVAGGMTMALLAALGAAGLLPHAFAAHGASGFEDVTLGSTWIAAACVAAAGWCVRGDERLRRLWLAGMLSVLGILAIRGGMQVFVEHPRTVQTFRAQRASILAAQGWSEGSSMARAYERRLLQPEASAWFGLANVYASLAAGLTLAFAGVAWGGRVGGGKAHKTWVLPALAALIGAGMLTLAGTKGAIAATLGMGAACLIAALLSRKTQTTRRRSLGTALGLFAIVGPLLAVVARGLVGQRIHELSVLFRWFYMQAAVRIIGEHPLTGVGPAGFKDAYLLAKNPLSPEEITSPHSILLDWLSTLGIAGAAWVVLLAVLAVAAGRAVCSAYADGQDHDEAPQNGRAQALTADGKASRERAIESLKLLFLALAAATVAAAGIEQAIAAPEQMAMRVAGLVGGLVLAWSILRPGVSTRWLSAAAGVGSLAIISHSQIELTGVTPGSVLWLLALASAASVARPCVACAPSRVSGPVVGAMAILGVFGTAVGPWILPTRAWDISLRHSAATLEIVNEFRTRLDILRTSEAGVESRGAIARDLSAALGRPVAETAIAIDDAYRELRLSEADDAARVLMVASRALEQRHFPTEQAVSRLAIQRAELMAGMHDEGAILIARLARATARHVAEQTNTAPAWAWLGVMIPATAPLLHFDPKAEAAAGIEVSLKAASLAPHELNYAIQLADAYAALGDPQNATRWAKNALGISEQNHLDPLREATDDQRRHLTALMTP